MRILIDMNGLDDGYRPILEAAAYMRSEPEIQITLIGKPDAEKMSREASIPFIVAEEEISTQEKNPAFAIRQKKNSSIVKGLMALREGEFDVFLSGGSTGALLAGGMVIVGRLSGYPRAVLLAPMPTTSKTTYLLDVGANVDVTPDMLVSFAKCAIAYVQATTGKDRPTLRLLNNGIEEQKGSELTKQAYALLQASHLPFDGNIEARDIFTGVCDIVITDGFTGNAVLKTSEGVFRFIMQMLKGLKETSWRAKLGLYLLKRDLKRTLRDLDPSTFGAVPLLGLNKIVMKMHGNSSTEAVIASIQSALRVHKSDILDRMRKQEE